VWLRAAGGEEAVQRAAIVAGFARAVRGAALGRGAVLRTVGLDSALGLSPQASAPPAFGVFHDLRWLMVYHSSWPAFLGEAVAAVLLRGLAECGHRAPRLASRSTTSGLSDHPEA